MALIDENIEYSFVITSYTITKNNELKTFDYHLTIGEEDSSINISREGTYEFISLVEFELSLENIVLAVLSQENIDDFEKSSIFKEAIEELKIGDRTHKCTFSMTNIL